MNDLYKNVDAVCCVLAAHRSRETIDRVLRTFVPNCEQLSNEYVSPPDDLGGSFSSPDEIIDYFVLNTNRAETLFWNQYENNPKWIMVGAFFTEDGHLIISLTIPADGEVEHKCLAKLKTLLLSDVGVISYTNPRHLRMVQTSLAGTVHEHWIWTGYPSPALQCNPPLYSGDGCLENR